MYMATSMSPVSPTTRLPPALVDPFAPSPRTDPTLMTLITKHRGSLGSPPVSPRTRPFYPSSSPSIDPRESVPNVSKEQQWWRDSVSVSAPVSPKSQAVDLPARAGTVNSELSQPRSHTFDCNPAARLHHDRHYDNARDDLLERQESADHPRTGRGRDIDTHASTVVDLSPCPASPSLAPTTMGGESHAAARVGARGKVNRTAGAGINRSTRPPDLLLATAPPSSTIIFDSDTPITPLVLSPPPDELEVEVPVSAYSVDVPVSANSLDVPVSAHSITEQLPLPVTPISGAPVPVPPPTPNSACTFGGHSPTTVVIGTSTSPVVSRGSEQQQAQGYYSRRGSTGTFGGTRSRGSIIQIPGGHNIEDVGIGEVVAVSVVSNESSSLTRSQTSPTVGPLGRTPPAGHWCPESPTAIMQHLLDARERNELAILPSEEPAVQVPARSSSFFGTSPKLLKKALGLAPPSAGSRVMPQLDEEHADEHTPAITHHLDLPSTKYWNNRHTGIFDLDEDQVDMVTHLRDRSASEAERVLDDLCDGDIDGHRGKLSTEIVLDVPQSPTSLEQSLSSHVPNLQMYRAASIESGSSGYSATTTAGLLPSATNLPLHLQTPHVISASASPTATATSGFILQPAPPRLPPSLSCKTDLPADQKAVLVKRTRKLEKVLGEPLPENTVEKFVVEPSMGATTTITRIEEGPWPRPHTEFIPEWLREDCVPQRASRPASMMTAQEGQSRSSRIARVLLGDPAPPVPTDLRVYVSRERHVAESREGEMKERQRADRLERIMVAPQPVPTSPVLSEPETSPEDVSRRTRRMQLTKLQRLLGDQVTSAIIASPSPTTSDENLPSARLPVPFTGLTRTLSNSSRASVLTERTRERWTSRFRRHHHGRADSPSPAPSPIGAGAREFAAAAAASAAEDTLSSEALSVSQRRLACKRATKLGKLFGDQPPPSLYMPTPTSETSGQDDGLGSASGGSTSGYGSSSVYGSGSGSPVYESYRQSISSLIFLVERDPERLARIVDELDYSADGGELLPATPAPSSPISTTSRTGRGRRSSAPPMSLSFTPPEDTLTPTHPLLSPAPTSPGTAKTTLPSLPASPPDRNSMRMRRRRNSKLAHFFGERSADFADIANAASRPTSVIADTSSAHTSTSGSDEQHHWSAGYPGSAGYAAYAGYSPYSTIGYSSPGYSGNSASRPISILLPPRPLIEPIVHNGSGSPDKNEREFHPLPPPPPPRRRSPGTARNSGVAAVAAPETETPSASAYPSPRTPALSVSPSPPTAFAAEFAATLSVPVPGGASVSAATSTITVAESRVVLGTIPPVPRRSSSISSLPYRPSAALRRRETLDGVLDELWEDVQSDLGRGSVDAGEAARLGDMMGVLRLKRDSEAWAEV